MQNKQRNVNRVSIVVLIMCVMFFALPVTAWATSVNTPGLSESTDPGVKDTSKSTFALFGDLVSAGQDVTVSKQNIASNLIAAAQNIAVINSKIGADVFVAGMSVAIENTEVANNVFAAGEEVAINAKTAGAVNVAANTVRLNGQAGAASIGGNDILIDGAFAGNVEVSGNNVTVGPNTVIKGRLTVTSSVEPTISPEAQIADYKFIQETDESADITAGVLAALFSLRIFLIITGILGMLLLVALLLALFTDRPFVNAGISLRQSPARVLLSGLVAMIVVPIGVLVLFSIVIGWQIAVIVLLACGVLSMLASAFAALAVGFLAFKNMNRWGAAMLMALIFGVVSAIPVLGSLLGLFCSMYIAGYVWTRYVDWRRGRTIQNRETPVQQGSEQQYAQAAPVPPQYESVQAEPEPVVQTPLGDETSQA